MTARSTRRTLAWLSLGVATMLGAIAATLATRGLVRFDAGPIGRWLVLAFAYGGVALGAWWTLRESERWSLRARVASIVLQTAGGFVDESLLYVVALQLPFVLPTRWGLPWLCGQIAVTVPAFVTVVLDRLEAEPTPTPMPIEMLVAVVAGLEVGWQSFAFFVGRIAFLADSRAEELARMQEVLAERTRLEERLAISRELHDVVGHHLAALAVNLDLARRLQPDGPAGAALGDAREIASSLLADVREVVGHLRSTPQTTLAAELRALAEGAHGLTLEWTVEVEPVVPHAHAIARCVREAMTNALRHGRATALRVHVTRDDGVVVRWRDDGVGATEVTEGHGLRGIRERVEELGGTLVFEGGPGFPVVLRLPESA
ncbi:MAG: sensor histidine kinase [Polyangiales bacterium]